MARHLLPPGEAGEMLLYGVQCRVVKFLLQRCETCLVLRNIVDDRHHHAERFLSRRQLLVHPRQVHEHQDLLLVAVHAGLAHREHVGRDGRDGQAERDAPLELVLDDQLWLNLILHQLDDVLQSVGRGVEQATETVDGVWSIWGSNNLGVKEPLYGGEMIRLPQAGVVWGQFQVQRLEGVLRIDLNFALQRPNLESDDAWFVSFISEIGEMFLRLDNVL